MEDTQAINWEIEEEEETERTGNSLECSLEPLGRLHIFSSVHGPEKDFPLYLGKNVVGRMPDCSVALPFPSISKQHAVIEILAWNKAPVLWDCGSLNGTQILRPPKFLSPGMSHRLRDQELVVFADLPCQYHRLDVSLPFVSRGPLTVEETPRVQGGTHSWGILLAEDSEEEVDPLSEQCMEKKPRAMSSPLATVIPESDEEGPSSAPDGPGPPCAFNLDSDTDEEESPQPAIGEACSAATRNSTADTYQPKAITTETQCEKDQYSGKEKKNDTRAKRDTGNGVVPVGVILERSQPAREDSETNVDDESRPSGRPVEVHLERALPSGFIDSDTDMEEEIPTTPATVPAKKRQILSGVSTESSGGPDLAHLQESLAGNDIDMETEVSLTIPLEHSQASMVISNNTDDEQEMSAALTLAHLKESQAALRNRGTGIVEDRGQSLALLSQTSSGRDSDTDKEEEKIPVEKREYIPNGHTDKAHSEKSRPPFRDSDREVEEDKSSPRIHLERSRAFATVGICTQVEEEVPPGPAVTFLNKDQVPMAWTNQANQTNVEAEEDPAKLPVVHLEEAQPNPGGDCETDADVRKSQLPTERDAGTEWVVPSLQQETALEAGAQGGPPIAQVEQDHLVSGENLTGLLVDTGTAEEPTQLQRKRAQHPRESGRKPHVDMTKDSGDNHDDSENIDLQATQCFVERENQTTEGTLDEPWEVLATQPFCLRESEASDTQSVAIHLDAHGSCPFSLRATPQDQHPENPFCIESLGIQGRGMQTVEKGIGTLEESAVRVTLERGPVGVETKKLPVEGSRENVIGEKELTRVMKDREQKQILVRDTQRQESNNMVKSTSMEKDMESLKEEIETPKELLEVVNQTLAREVFEKEAEKPAPETECEPDGLEVSIPKVILEGGTQRLGTKSGNWDQKGQTISSPTLEPEGEAEDLMGLSSALIASGSQSSGRRRAPVCPRRWQRGHLNCKMPNAEKISRGDPESLDACLPPTVPEASAPVQNPFVSQSQKYPPQALFASSPHSLEPPIPRTRQNGSQEVLENPLSSELDPLCGKPKVRPQRCSRMTPSPVSSVALESQPVTPEPTSRATRGRTHRSSNKMLEPVVPTAPELQPSTSKDQPVTPEPKSQAARGRACRSSVKTPEPVVLTASELQPSTSKGQPVTPEPTSQATWGRTCRSSVKIPEPVVPTAPELQPSTSKDQPVTPEPTSRAARGRTCRSSVKIPEPVVLTAPELQPSTSKDQPVTLQPTSLATWGRIHRSSVKTYQTTEPTSLDLGPPTPTYQSVTHKAIAQGGQSRTLRPRRNAVPVSTTLEFQYPVPKDQPISLEPIPQAYCGRRPRSTRKHGSLTAPVVYEPCSAPLESNSVSSRNQKRGAVRAAKSLRAIPEPEAPTHVFQIQKVESAGRCEFTPETQPKASQNRKRPSGTVASPLLQKRVQRGEVPQKTVFLKEEEYTAKKPEKEEDVIIPGPGKRKKEQAKEVPGRSLRRTKPKHGPIAPKVLFTGVVDAHGEQIVLTLGGSLASSVVEASHLVTDRICRTVKFLCALGRGIPILSLDWLHQSHKAGCFLCPDDYVVTDFEQEKNFGFSLRESLSRARERRLLEGYEIHVTPGVQPPPPQMAEIISCCGGTILPSMPRSYKPQRVVITCSQDIPRCCTPLRVGLPILSPEFLLTGVLKQEAKPEAFVLSTLEMSST